MSDHEDDDPQLRSLRAVWLALPDEEPPASGLDALMAAARTKAAEMAAPAPTFWQRLAALFRRPPVLALVTVVLLLGGGLIVTRAQKSSELAPPAPRPETSDPAVPTPATGTVPAPATDPATATGTAAVPAPESAAVPATVPTPVPVPVPVPAPAPAPAPARAPAPSAESAAAHHTAATKSGSTSAKSKAAPTKADADAPFSNDALELAAPRPADPVSAARAAAARGDCATARSLVSNLKSPNAANDPALARCLAEQ